MSWDKFPWATALMFALVLVAAAVGGAVVIWGASGALSFEQYLKLLEGFAVAVGLLGVGRGVKSGLQNHGLGAVDQAYDPSGGGELDELDATDRAEPRRAPRKPARRGTGV